MPERQKPPIGFAHRGARAHAPENTIEAFELAVRLGATGLESDVWITRDGVAVLDHDGVIGRFPRRTPIRKIDRVDLPDHIPSLAELYDAVGAELPVSLDVKDPEAFEATLAAARTAGAAERLWLCHPDWRQVAAWREAAPEVRLVDSTRIAKISEGAETRAARLRKAGVDVVNLHRTDWSKGLVTLFHRFDLATLGWDAQQPRHIAGLLDMGIDGVFSDHVDRLADVFARYGYA